MYNQSCSSQRIYRLASAYMDAKEFVIRNGYINEIDWQEDLSFECLTESNFLAEAAWVILSSGMKATVIEKLFTHLSRIFLEWNSACQIVESKTYCRKMALEIFNNPAKIDAIIYISEYIYTHGFDSVYDEIRQNGTEYLKTFPFIGPTTAFHLAKNIGLPVAKPDRHLVRVAQVAGYQCPAELCRDIADYICENVAVVDLVIWRYATLRDDYLNHFNLVSEH